MRRRRVFTGLGFLVAGFNAQKALCDVGEGTGQFVNFVPLLAYNFVELVQLFCLVGHLNFQIGDGTVLVRSRHGCYLPSDV